MAHPPAAASVLRDGDAEVLGSWVRSTTVPARLAHRAQLVLLAADGIANTQIVERVGVARQTVVSRRASYTRLGVDGLRDAPRSGRPRRIDHAAIINATLRPPPKKLGVTHWSSRLLATHLGIGNATVARAWREYG